MFKEGRVLESAYKHCDGWEYSGKFQGEIMYALSPSVFFQETQRGPEIHG